MTNIKFLSGWEWRVQRIAGMKGYVTRNGQEAFFKSIMALGRGSRPHGGFEFLGSLLAHKMGLNAPEYFVCELRDGAYGVGSFLVPPPMSRFDDLPKTLQTEQLMSKFGGPSVFVKLLVFDVFTGNNDRNARNLICRTLSDKHWELYLIDHNDLFYGAQWLSDYNVHHEFTQFINNANPRLMDIFEIILREYQNDIHKTILDFQAIDDEELMSIIQGIPNEFLSEVQKQRAFEVLQHRKSHLQDIFRL